MRKNLQITNFRCIFASAFGGIAQLARAPALQAGGRRFDSDYLHQAKTPFQTSGKAFFLVSEIYTFVSESLLKGRYIDISKLDTLPDG